MTKRDRLSLLCAVALLVATGAGAGAASVDRPLARELDGVALKAAVRAAALPGGPVTEDERKRYRDCSFAEYTDSPDGTPLDIATYESAYDCVESDGWLFAVNTYDAWPRTSLDFIAINLDTDMNAATGCEGDDYLVFGYYDAEFDDHTGAVFRTPACGVENATVVSSASVLQPEPTELGVLFDHFAIGSPTTFRWYGELAAFADTAPERFPKTGVHVEEGFLETCAPQRSSTEGYVTRSHRAAGVAAALRSAGAGQVEEHAYGIVTFDAPDLPSMLAAVAAIDREAVVEPNRRRMWSVVPNDTEYRNQWGLHAVGAERAWDLTRGSASVVVAVVDSGVDASHPQLAGKLVAGYDATTGAALAAGNSDPEGHGTAVTGLVAARTNDASSVASLGWDTRVMPIKAGGEQGPLTSDVVEGLRWAVDNGARVVNLSLGSCNPSQIERDAVAYAESRGVLLVAAAGNSGPGSPAEYPAAYSTVVAVGASGFGHTIAPYSNTGAHIDIVAPGGSADGDPRHSLLVLQTGGGEALGDGTSFSSPIVAAAAALVYARNADQSPAGVRNVLTSTAADRGAFGRDDVFGAGELDAARAVAAALAPSPGPTPTGGGSPTPSPSSAPVTPTLTAPTTAIAGVLITVSGTAAPGAEVELWGVTAPNGTITRVNTPVAVADSTGQWTKTIRPLRNVNLQARVGTAWSATRFIAVSTAVRQSVSPLAGCVVQVSGAVFEPKPGATVFIRAIDSAGRTVSLGTGSVQGDGRFLLRKPYACGQLLSVYTVISGDNVNRPGGTGVQRIVTRR